MTPDGRVGAVRSVHRDPATGQILSLTVHVGTVQTFDLTVPVDAVAEMTADRVRLLVTRDEIEGWVRPGTEPTI